MLDQLLADERPDIRMIENVIQRRFQIGFGGPARRHHQTVQQRLRSGVVVRLERHHRADVVRRIVLLQRRAGLCRISPPGIDFREILNRGLIVGGNRIAAGVQLADVPS